MDESEPSARALTPQRSFRSEVERKTLANQLELIDLKLNQLFSALPDKVAVEISRDNIFAVMQSMAKVASKENLIAMGDRLGGVETDIRTISRTTTLNERDVKQLREGQTEIRDALRQENVRLENALNEKKHELDAKIDGAKTELRDRIKDIDTELDIQTAALRQDLNAQTVALTEKLDTQTEKLSDKIQVLSQALADAKSINARYLLATLIAIVGLVIAVAGFVYKAVVPDQQLSAVSTASPTITQPSTTAPSSR
jgi:hypothetical protein